MDAALAHFPTNHEVSLFRAGDSEIFTTLIETHKRAVFGVAYGTVGDAQIAEDLAQEAFLAAWKSRETLRDASKFRPWICGIARNLARKELRRQARHPESEPPGPEIVGEAQSALDDVLVSERNSNLWENLQRVSDTYREVLILYYQEGQSAHSVARTLDISEALVSQRLKRGREQLKDILHSQVLDELSELHPSPEFDKRVLAVALGAPYGAATIATAKSSSLLPGIILMYAAKITLGIIVAIALFFAFRPSGDTSSQSDSQQASVVASTERAEPAGESETATQPTSTRSKPMESPRNSQVPPALDQDSDSESVLTYSVGPANEGNEDFPDTSIWYRLHDGFPQCVEEHLDKTRIEEEEMSVLLTFSQGEGRSILANAKVTGGVGGTQEFESCVVEKLSGFVFPPNVSDTVVRFGFKNRAIPQAPDADTIASVPDAIGSQAQGPSRGSADAPLTLVVYTDFQCSYCATLLGTMDELLEKYDGKIRIVTKLFPLKPSSRLLAAASVAAGMQDKFWPMHNWIFANHGVAGVMLGEAQIVAQAQTLKLDMDVFLGDWKSETVSELVQEDLDHGKILGVTATPTTFVGKTKIVGWQPIANFVELVEAELSAD